MRKYYIKPIIILMTMIIMVFTLNFLSKDKLIVETIEGDLSNLSDVSLVYTPRIKDLKREETVINNDGTNTYKASDHVVGRNFIDIDKDHNDFIKYVPTKNIVQDDNYIGTVQIMNYAMDENHEILIKIKSKKNNDVKTYNIPINSADQNNDTYHFNLIFKMMLHNEDIYVVGCDSESVYIAKINLSNKSYKLMNRIDESFYKTRDLVTLKYKDKVYIEAKSDKCDFYVYDIKDNSIKANEYYEHNKNNNFKSEQILHVNTHENTLEMILKDNENIVMKYEYDLNDNGVKLDNIDVYDYKIDFSYLDNRYYGGYESGIKNISVYNDKIYSLNQRVTYTKSETKDGAVPYIKGNKPIEYSVFDMNKNELVYKANLITPQNHIEYSFNFIK